MRCPMLPRDGSTEHSFLELLLSEWLAWWAGWLDGFTHGQFYFGASNCALVRLMCLDWLLGLCHHSLLSLPVCPGVRVKAILIVLWRGFDTLVILEWDCAFPTPPFPRDSLLVCAVTQYFFFWLVLRLILASKRGKIVCRRKGWVLHVSLSDL